jgi:hypothetical protein
MESDLQQALLAWQGVPLPPERSSELLERLRNDAAFRAAFADKLWTLSLTRVAQAPDPRWLSLYEEIGLGAAPAQTEEWKSEAVILEGIRREPLRFVRAWWRWAAYGALAATVALALGLWQLASTKPAASERSIATLVASRDAVWKSATTNLGTGLPAGRLQLVSGGVSLSFQSGVLLHVQGPADVELIDGQRVFCHEGRLRMRVPPGAEGFYIDTPGGGVTDLGTELGVAVKPGQNTRVAVFEGKAEAALNVPGQGGVRTEVLQAHQGAELHAKSGEIRSSGLAGFLEASEIPEPPLLLSADYPQLVQSAKPALYWRIDRLTDGRVPEESGAGPALELSGAVALQADSGGRASAIFSGGAIYADQAWTLPGNSYALECWFFSQPMAAGALAGFTMGREFKDHFIYLEFPGRLPGKSPQPGIIRYLNRWPAAGSGGISIYSQPKTFPYRWHHLVAQQSGTHLELYVDGELVGNAQGTTIGADTLCAIQFGTLRSNFANHPYRVERPFTGRLAEIAVYPRLLSPGEIQQHAAQLGSAPERTVRK